VAGATLTAETTGSGGVFNNYSDGTFTQQGGAGSTTQVTVPFHNDGQVDVQNGLLRLWGGGTHLGDFAISSATTLELGGGHAFDANSVITGAGTLRHSNGTTNFAGQLSASGSLQVAGGTFNLTSDNSISSLQLTGGTLSGAGDLVMTGASSWTSGAMVGTGTTTISSGGVLTMSERRLLEPEPRASKRRGDHVDWQRLAVLQWRNSHKPRQLHSKPSGRRHPDG
jgi:hypothetical protein